jgi:hypothetical protein
LERLRRLPLLFSLRTTSLRSVFALICLASSVCWLGGVFESAAPALAADPAKAEPPIQTYEHLTPPQLGALYPDQVVPFVKKYCVDCHAGKEAEAELDLTKYKSVQDLAKDRRAWRLVSQKIRSREMPPDDYDQRPADHEAESIANWIDVTMKAAICRGTIDPGRVTIHRLNRAEYNNTIRDLVGVDFQPADDFPSDDVGYGFDNIGDVLALPPILLEKYLAAAEKIMDRALVVDDPAKTATTRLEGKKLQPDKIGLGPDGEKVLASNGEVFAEFDFPREGTYQIRVQAYGDQAGPDPARMTVLMDSVPGQKPEELKTFDVANDRLNVRTFTITKSFSPGKRKIAAQFINDFYEPQEKDKKKGGDRNLGVNAIEVRGPLGIDDSKLTESHKRIMIATPPAAWLDENPPRRRAGFSGKESADRKKAEAAATQRGEQRVAAAKKILANFATRAFRRPVTDTELARLMKLWEATCVADAQPFERGIQVACSAVLISPHFLFRIELDPKPNDPNYVYKLNDHEVATRLSYFLWSTMPDDELRKLADSGELLKGDNLVQQVRRMMRDRHTQELVNNFGGQWLQTRRLEGLNFDQKVYRNFDQALRESMDRETSLFFATLMVEDRSILEFLDSDFTFLNERLAKHYGIEGIMGDYFRRVDLSGSFDAVQRRGGLLGMASILALNSNPARTSPVKRGKWIMENLLGTPPPPPPPMVPELDDDNADKKGALSGTLKQRLEKHRSNAVCASCHKVMDNLGFGLENFDALGSWREKDGKETVDPTGILPNGSKFSGPNELKEVLKSKKDLFARCLTEKMLTYALGRGLEEYDECTVDKIVKQVQAQNYKFSSLMIAIVQSEPFLQKRGAGVRP